MKTLLGCSAQVVLVVVVASLIAVPLACGATLTAPLHTPQIAEKFMCPPETQMKAEWYQATWNKPGEKTLSVVCVDAAGQEMPTQPQDERALWTGIQAYFPYVFAPVLVFGIIILLGLNVIGTAIGAALKKISQPKSGVSLTVVAALIIGSWGFGASVPAASAASTPAKLASPEGLLNADGTLNLGTGFSGALDLDGYTIQIDAQQGPVFTPATPPGEWDNLGDG